MFKQMKSIFRKVAIVVIAVFTMSVAANAQEKGDMAVGGNLVYRFSAYSKSYFYMIILKNKLIPLASKLQRHDSKGFP